MKHLSKSCLWLIKKEKLLTSEDVSGKDETVSIHYKNLQDLLFEMFKFKISPTSNALNYRDYQVEKLIPIWDVVETSEYHLWVQFIVNVQIFNI